MSAFAAVFDRAGGECPADVLARLTAALGAHGPPAIASATSGPVSLVHATHFARTDATVGPHRGRDGTLLAGDIRIDDQRALRRALAAAGEPVADDATDEILVLSAWAAWREDAAAHLLGDFSFVLWEPATQTFYAARDALGVRPLFYAEVGDLLICSTMLEVVRAHPAVSARLDDAAIVSWIRYGFNDDYVSTSFADVRRVPPAHHFVARPGNSPRREARHWQFPEPPPLHLRDPREYVEGFRQLLDEAVRDRLRLPTVALMLSGGLDSPALAATARRVAPDVRIAAFTVRVPSLAVDPDPPLARLVAERLGIEQTLLTNVNDPLRFLGDPAIRTPEPDGNPNLDMYLGFLREMAKVSVVTLQGEDGDTLLSPTPLAEEMRRWGTLATARRLLGFLLRERRKPYTGWYLRRRLSGLWRRSPVPGVMLLRSEWHREVPSIARPSRVRGEVAEGLGATIWQNVQEHDSAAFVGVPTEMRFPLLDVRVIAYVLAIPTMPWCQQKQLLREAFRGELPDAVLARRKQGYGALGPDAVRRWRARAGSSLVQPSARIARWIDPRSARRALDSADPLIVQEGWQALLLDHWLAQFD